MSSVDVVLPCLNEAEALPGVLASLPAGYRAIVVDNGSTDGSDQIARDAGATVVRATQRGYGAAVHAGLEAAQSDIVAFCDADGSFDMAQLARVVDPVRTGERSLMLGRRRPQRWTAWPLPARFANSVLLSMVRRRTGLPLRDLGPMRAGRRTELLALGIADRRSGYPLELLLRAKRAGWTIREVDVAYLPRKGKSKVTGTLRGMIQATGDMSAVLRSLS